MHTKGDGSLNIGAEGSEAHHWCNISDRLVGAIHPKMSASQMKGSKRKVILNDATGRELGRKPLPDRHPNQRVVGAIAGLAVGEILAVNELILRVIATNRRNT